MIGLFQFNHPPGAVVVEDEMDLVMGFLEFFDRFQHVDDVLEAFTLPRICLHHDCDRSYVTSSVVDGR